MTYLITGGSGFIGSHLVEALLKNGHSVINIDNFDDFYDYKIKVKNTLESVGNNVNFAYSDKDSDLQKLAEICSSENYKLYYADIRDAEKLNKIFDEDAVDMVIHLAALAGVRPSIERPMDYEEVNIKGTMNLWEICKKNKISKFICASSSSVYGNNEKIPFAEEDFVDQPISPYAATKKCCEILGHVYYHLYDMDMAFLRFFTVYGPRQRPDLAIHKFAKLIAEGKEIPFYGDGSTCRDYTFIDDIIDGIFKTITFLEKNSKVYEIINLGENKVIQLDEMLKSLETEMSLNAYKKMLPLQPGDVQKTNADITKARKLIGYNPTTDFQIGIKKFVEWFLRNAHEK